MSEAEKEILSWADGAADHVIARHSEPYVCEGMWTPSGFFHIGNARAEIFTPNSVANAIHMKGHKVTQNFIIDDFDAVRKIPGGLGIAESDADRFLGFPCATAPSPIPGYKTWADAFVSQVREYAGGFGVKLNIMSAYESYREGKFNDLILETLKKSDSIVQVWNRVAGTQKEEDFVPLQVMCEGCKRIYYTAITGFDGGKVSYSCKCGTTGSVSPLNGNAKLHWRVHWVAHWIVHKVDFESGGKDHFSKGGSVDMGRALMKDIFGKEPPYQLPTEFIQLKGEKMSGSKGNVINLEQWLKTASPELFRYMNYSYKPGTVIEFSFSDNSFVLLNDRYENAERTYYGLEKHPSEKLTEKICRDFELSAIESIPKILPRVPSFSSCILLSQLFDVSRPAEAQKALTVFRSMQGIESLLPLEEKRTLAKLTRVRSWLSEWAPEDFRVKVNEEVTDTIRQQIPAHLRAAIKELPAILRQKHSTESDLGKAIYAFAKSHNLNLQEFFRALYWLFISRERGARISTLVSVMGTSRAIALIEAL
ncbi:MAG: lysine--tRNA ligase [Candidatus Diapherotrites archaeon]|nr:lysine--tRNA ligase [Candidatus Diapherotrites archaeon]